MDVETYALLKAYIKKALIDGGNVTPEEREKISKLIIDESGQNFLADDGTYKPIPEGTKDYEDLTSKPSINGIELTGNKTASQLNFATVASTGSYEDLTNLPTPIVYLSQLQNDTGFITNTVGNLVNYYTKAQAYTKMEVNQMIGNLSTLNVEIVTVLPTENISLNTIYLIKDEDTGIYAQWMYLNNVWANIGSTEIDLTQYYTKIEVSNLLLNKVDKEFGMGLSQENYTTQEADKLAGLSNYVLPRASTAILGGVKVDGTTITADSQGVITAIGGGGGDIIDDNITSTTKTWSSDKISDEIDIVGDIANDISIAQKTVNTRGTKELLTQEYSYNLTPASINGTSVLTAINSTITLKESILNYDTINIQLKINTNTVKTSYPTYTFKTSSVVFNNSNTLNFADGSVMNINKIQGTVSAGAWGSSSASLSFWFKDETHMFILNAGAIYSDIGWANVVMSSVQGVNIENVTIDPVNYVNTTQGIEDTPVGHILSQMGKVAPKHYLICDGMTYNILDYPYLSQYIKDQFGTFNYFGGNGTTTFSVPDLRNEFLRGYHGTKIEQLSGEIGAHQSATNLLNTAIYRSGSTGQFLPYYSNSNGASLNTNMDSITLSALGRLAINGTLDTSALGSTSTFTSRPTNTAVLYCIKYEPTYFMNLSGVLETTTLWEGNAGTVSTTVAINSTITLNSSIMNYDRIGVEFNSRYGGNSIHYQYKEILSNELMKLIDQKQANTYVPFILGYTTSPDYSNINLLSSTYTSFLFNQLSSYVTKIVGIKYKTSQSADVSYTNQEITDMVEEVYYGN